MSRAIKLALDFEWPARRARGSNIDLQRITLVPVPRTEQTVAIESQQRFARVERGAEDPPFAFVFENCRIDRGQTGHHDCYLFPLVWKYDCLVEAELVELRRLGNHKNLAVRLYEIWVRHMTADVECQCGYFPSRFIQNH